MTIKRNNGNDNTTMTIIIINNIDNIKITVQTFTMEVVMRKVWLEKR